MENMRECKAEVAIRSCFYGKMTFAIEISMDNNSFVQLPDVLMSREGWSDLLEDQRTPEPRLHQIEPTNHCPYTCRMCPRTTLMTRPLGFMDFDLYRKVMEEVAGYSEPVRSREIELFHFARQHADAIRT